MHFSSTTDSTCVAEIAAYDVSQSVPNLCCLTERMPDLSTSKSSECKARRWATPTYHHSTMRFLWCLTGMCRTWPPSRCTIPRSPAPPHVQHHTRTSEATCKTHAQMALDVRLCSQLFLSSPPISSSWTALGERYHKAGTEDVRSAPHSCTLYRSHSFQTGLFYPEYELRMAEPARVVVLELAP